MYAVQALRLLQENPVDEMVKCFLAQKDLAKVPYLVNLKLK